MQEGDWADMSMISAYVEVKLEMNPLDLEPRVWPMRGTSCV